MNNDVETRELVSAILGGDVKKFALIIERYKRLVAHIVYKMIPNETDGEDLCQDIFMKVYSKLETFQFDSKLSTWIGRISYNHCLNYLEKKKVLLLDDLSDEANGIDHLPIEEKTPIDVVSAGNIASILEKEINKLPAHYRTIITLYHMDELTYSEISEITGLPEGTVKSHLFRGRKLLKERLEVEYKQEDLCH